MSSGEHTPFVWGLQIALLDGSNCARAGNSCRHGIDNSQPLVEASTIQESLFV